MDTPRPQATLAFLPAVPYPARPGPANDACRAVWEIRHAAEAEADGWALEADIDGFLGLVTRDPARLPRFDRVAAHVVRMAEAGSVLHRAALAVIGPIELGFIARFTRWNPTVVQGQFNPGDDVQVLGVGGWVDGQVTALTPIGYMVFTPADPLPQPVWWNTVREPEPIPEEEEAPE